MSRAAESRAKLDKLGVDDLCEALCSGSSLTGYANEVGVSLSSLLSWIDAESDRSARVREARVSMGKVWDEKAEDVIKSATDEFQLKKARELAQHYRWRSTKTAVRDYGDNVNVTAQVTLEQLVSSSMASKPESPAE